MQVYSQKHTISFLCVLEKKYDVVVLNGVEPHLNLFTPTFQPLHIAWHSQLWGVFVQEG